MRTFEALKEEIRVATRLNNVESLLQCAEELGAHDTQQARALACNAYGYGLYLKGEFSEALRQFERAHDIYATIGLRADTARAVSNMGLVYWSSGDYPSAIEHYNRALSIHKDVGDHAGVSVVLGNLGLVYTSQGEYPTALEYYQRALLMHEERGDTQGIARVTANLGIVFRSTGDYPSALEQYRKALDIAEQNGDLHLTARLLGNIGNLYNSLGDLTSALDFNKRALTLHTELGARAEVARVNANIGIVYSGLGDHDAARRHLVEALTIQEDIGSYASLVNTIGNLISVFISSGQYDEAAVLLDRQASLSIDDPSARSHHYGNRALLSEHYNDLDTAHEMLLKSLQISTLAGLRDVSAECHTKLRDLAQIRNDFAGYIEHNNEYQRITEEINGKATAQKLAMMEAQKQIDAERAEKERHRNLLHNTLPPSIADRVLRGEQVNDSFDNAAVMFMDMVGFTTMSASMDPNEVVRMLSEVFTACDAIMAEHDLMKIKTIGDSYMAVAFPNEPTSSELRVASIEERAARAATAILHMISDRFPQIQVRIGIHCGPVTAGVIGTERLQYDVWGDTVNVASRMESNSQPGRIHVSSGFALALNFETTKGRIGEMALTLRGEVEIKGKGTMTTFWLEGK